MVYLDDDENRVVPMVVTQVEKDVVVNKVGKPEVKPRIVAFIEVLYSNQRNR